MSELRMAPVACWTVVPGPSGSVHDLRDGTAWLHAAGDNVTWAQVVRSRSSRVVVVMGFG